MVGYVGICVCMHVAVNDVSNTLTKVLMIYYINNTLNADLTARQYSLVQRFRRVLNTQRER